MQLLKLHSVMEIVNTNILKFISTEDFLNMCLADKKLRNILYSIGFYKKLVYNSFNFIEFTRMTSFHRRTLQKMVYNKITNPSEWIVDGSCCLELDACRFDSFNPSTAKRKIHTIYFNYCKGLSNFQTQKTIPVINWERFPNLERVYIIGMPVSLTGISRCKKLNTLVYKSNSNNWYCIPREIFQLPNLVNLAFTCHIQDINEDYGNMNIVIGNTTNFVEDLVFYENKTSIYGDYKTIEDDEMNQVRIKNIC